MTYDVIDREGMFCTQGLQGPDVCDEARNVAQRIADRRQAPVWLVPSDYEGSDPWSDGERFDPSAVEEGS